jgi:hypothetical protein
LQSSGEAALMISQFGSRFSGGRLTFGYLDGRRWMVPRDYSYELRDGRVSTVRAGFIFDFASVPRLLWRLLPPAGLAKNPYGLASTWHDWLYRHGRIAGQAISRFEADHVFLEIMRHCGVSRVVARTIYDGVRLGGWWTWRRARKADAIREDTP